MYKKYNINPLSSLLGPFITLPIFIAVYSAVKDTTVIFEGDIAGLLLGNQLGNSITSGSWLAILLFIGMAISQFVTMKLPQWLNKKKQSKLKQKQKAPSTTNIIMYFFLIMIVVVAWSLPVAMSVYWIASSLFSVFQTFLMKWIDKPVKEEHIDISKRLGA